MLHGTVCFNYENLNANTAVGMDMLLVWHDLKC